MSNVSSFAQLNTDPPSAGFSINTLWAQAIERLPEVRNATHYYVHDAQRMLSTAAQHVVKVANQQTASSADDSSSNRRGKGSVGASSPAGATEQHEMQREVHYYAAPPASTPKVAARRVYLSPLRQTGQLFLILLLEKGGYGIFEVRGSVVQEVVTEMTGEPLVAICPMRWPLPDGTVVTAFVSVSESAHISVFREKQTGASDSASLCIYHKQTIEGCTPQDALVMDDVLILLNKSFAQILILRIPTFEEIVSLSTDGNLTVAASHSWLAFCSLEDGAAQSTKFDAEKTQSRIETVAKGVSGIASLLWGTTPGASPQSGPLGSVSLYDTVSNSVFASFYPHNHPVACMSFSGDGTMLATASTQGTSVNVFQVFRGGSSGDHSSVSLIARLVRGVTVASICSIAFSPGSVYVAASTAVGTCHVFDLSSVLDSRGQKRVAPQISPTARVRSAPTPKPPTPCVYFDHLCRNIGDPLNRSMSLHIASNRVVVTHVAVFRNGAVPMSSAYLSTFQGPAAVEGKSADSSSEKDAVDEFDERKLFQKWNAGVELETHQQGALIENFSVDGLTPFAMNTDDGSDAPQNLEWVDVHDEAADVQRSGSEDPFLD